MKKSSALNTLIELATRETDDTAQALGRALRNAEEAQKKLSMLEEYRAEYAARCQENLGSGLSVAGYRNFQQFMEKLDEAVISQTRALEHANDFVEQRRALWQASERKRISFDALDQRAQKAAERDDAKRDQKEMDEFASRSLSFRR